MEIKRGSIMRVSIIDKEPKTPGAGGVIEGFHFVCTLSVRRKDMANGNWADGRATGGSDSASDGGPAEG